MEGEFTFTGERGCTVIDYIVGEEKVRYRVRRMKVGDKVDADHQRLEVWVEDKIGRKNGVQQRE